MDIVLLGFFAQLVIIYAFILVGEYGKRSSARTHASDRALATLSSTSSSPSLTVVGSKASAEDVRRRA